jgi:hypothetical protein
MIPDPLAGGDLHITVTIRVDGPSMLRPISCDMSVSNLAMRTIAEKVELPPGLMFAEPTYERRMIRRALVPLVKRACEQSSHIAAWTAVSAILGLDPETGQ